MSAEVSQHLTSENTKPPHGFYSSIPLPRSYTFISTVLWVGNASFSSSLLKAPFILKIYLMCHVLHEAFLDCKIWVAPLSVPKTFWTTFLCISYTLQILGYISISPLDCEPPKSRVHVSASLCISSCQIRGWSSHSVNNIKLYWKRKGAEKFSHWGFLFLRQDCQGHYTELFVPQSLKTQLTSWG